MIDEKRFNYALASLDKAGQHQKATKDKSYYYGMLIQHSTVPLTVFISLHLFQNNVESVRLFLVDDYFCIQRLCDF